MIMTIALLYIRIVEFLARLKRAIEIELAVRHAITELSGLSDYMLRDLGITRGEIESVVRRPNVPVGTNDGLSIPGGETASIVPSIVAIPHRANDGPVRSDSFPPRGRC